MKPVFTEKQLKRLVRLIGNKTATRWIKVLSRRRSKHRSKRHN
jgi:hypothetical protein